MRKLALLFCSALMAFGADDPWAKLKDLKSGTELRVYRKGTAQPLAVKMGELTDDNLVVIEKNKETAISRDEIDRVDCRPAGKSRMTSETTTKNTAEDPMGVIPGGGNGSVPSTTTSSNVSIGGKTEFETIYKRPPSPPKK